MNARRIFQVVMVVAILSASLVSAGPALAGGAGCASYITVQSGDTLSSIAAVCGTTVAAIQAANPGLGWSIWVGQVLHIPTGFSVTPVTSPLQTCSNTYMVVSGDTVGGIAMLFGASFADLLAANPQIGSGNLIYPGQVIHLPASANCSFTGYSPSSSPSTVYVPTPTPAPLPARGDAKLKVTYKFGLRIRSGPGLKYSEIVSPLVGATKNSIWQYQTTSMTEDADGLVWVEIMFGLFVDGRSTGWIAVSDVFGDFFTWPEIGPDVRPKRIPVDP